MVCGGTPYLGGGAHHLVNDLIDDGLGDLLGRGGCGGLFGLFGAGLGLCRLGARSRLLDRHFCARACLKLEREGGGGGGRERKKARKG